VRAALGQFSTAGQILMDLEAYVAAGTAPRDA
jgi:hypothetical protein